MRWFHKAADNGNGHATVKLFTLYEYGWTNLNTGRVIVKRDEVEAEKWFGKTVQLGDPEALIELGNILFNRGSKEQKEEAVKLFHQAADNNFAEAQYILGVIYATGECVKKNPSESVMWFRRAAENGNAALQLRVGDVFGKKFILGRDGLGRGNPIQDNNEAAMWFRRAAENGNALMQYETGINFYLGGKDRYGQYDIDNNGKLRDPVDPAEAFKWLYKTATEGRSMLTPVNSYLATYYGTDKGIMVTTNALYLYNAWYLTACQLVGYMYREGLGVPKDEKEAEKWLVYDDKGPTSGRMKPFIERDRKLMEDWNARWSRVNPE